jgi:hypothetical protein
MQLKGMVWLFCAGAGGCTAERNSSALTASCEDCGIALIAVTTIDGGRSPELANYPFSVARDRVGRIILSPRDLEPPIVFDASGQYVSPLGRTGSGPGESMATGWIDAGRDDSIRVFEKARVSVFGPDLTFARTTALLEPFPVWQYTLDVLSDGHYLIGRQECTADGICTNAISRRSPQGRTVDTLPRFDGVVASARDSAFYWAAQPLAESAGYALELKDTLGHSRLRLDRQPAFATIVHRPGAKYAIRTTPRDVREDPQGTLVVLLLQPKADAATITSPQGAFDLFDTVVEVIDLKTRRVTGSRRINASPLRILDDRHIATYRISSTGNPVVEVWAVTLTSR